MVVMETERRGRSRCDEDRRKGTDWMWYRQREKEEADVMKTAESVVSG